MEKGLLVADIDLKLFIHTSQNPQELWLFMHNQRGLKTHMLIHSVEKESQCKQSDFSCKQTGTLAYHMFSPESVRKCDYSILMQAVWWLEEAHEQALSGTKVITAHRGRMIVSCQVFRVFRVKIFISFGLTFQTNSVCHQRITLKIIFKQQFAWNFITHACDLHEGHMQN